jgi:hypothetical protein
MKSDPVDEAVSRRLAKLASMPVDTSRLERAVRAHIGSPAAPWAWRRMLRPIAAVAASLLIMTAIAFAMLQERPVSASDMARMHRDIVAGRVQTMQVDSPEEARAYFASVSAGVPTPDVPAMHTMRCCMADVGNKKVACVLLNDGKTPVTLSMAESSAFKKPATAPEMHNGQAYFVQSDRELTMVMTDRGAHRICLMGEMPAEKLMSLAESLRF